MVLNLGQEPKNMMNVVILTHNYRVVGWVYVKKGARLTDAVCEARPFIAVAAAQVWERQSGIHLLQAGFINVSRDKIEVILPAEEVVCDSEEMGSLGTWLLEQRRKVLEAQQEQDALDLDVPLAEDGHDGL
ncbi:MAG: hypothetical protein PHV45_07625 [Desulfuromonas thiophila]|nr:hypothetical protein [Desulfuromonas thiophila]MDD3802057.1 hypothetical protein [Desulfuromonas thiophila]